MGKPNPRSIYLSRKNQLTTLIKNYETANIVKHVTELLLRYILYSLATLIKTRDIKIPAAIFTAIIWNLKNLGKTLKKRKQIQTMRKVSDNEIKKYMLTKKRYEELTSYLSRAY